MTINTPKMALPAEVSQGLLASAVENVKKLQNNGSGSTTNLQNLFNNIQPPDTSTPTNLPDYSKMQQQTVTWNQPKYNTNGKVTQTGNSQQIANPNNFAFVNMLAGKGTGAWLPTMQNRQFQEQQQQNYLNNLAGATQLDQNQRQWQSEYDTQNSQWQRQFDANNSQWQQTFDYGKLMDAIKNNQWQQEFDYGKYNDANNLALNWSQVSGYLPNGTDTLAGKIANRDYDHTKSMDALDWIKTFGNAPGTQTGGGSVKAFDDLLATDKPAATTTTPAAKVDQAAVMARIRELEAVYNSLGNPQARKDLQALIDAERKKLVG